MEMESKEEVKLQIAIQRLERKGVGVQGEGFVMYDGTKIREEMEKIEQERMYNLIDRCLKKNNPSPSFF